MGLTWLNNGFICKELYAVEIGLSVMIAFIYQLVMPHWG